MRVREAIAERLRRSPPEEDTALVQRSIRRYARMARRYDRSHPEIFNSAEQSRLRAAVADAVALAGAADRPVDALDLGCGSGNVTGHLLDRGARVTAADVSPQFLALIERRFGAREDVQTLLVNGLDLGNVPDGSFDLVTAYSVLHHIPDYLGILDELARVVRPGGVIYLDHEVNDNVWDLSGCVGEFRRELAAAELRRPGWWNPARRRWQRFLIPSKYVTRFKLMVNPEWYWGVEGDIHVWPGKHVVWQRVEDRLAAAGCQIVRRDDYLLYREGYDRAVYDRFRDGCSDMRMVMAQRPRSPGRAARSAETGS